MSVESIITTSREKSHLLLADLFKSKFGDDANFDKTSFNAWAIETLTDIQRSLAISMTLEKEEQFLNTCKNISTARAIGYENGFSGINVNPAKALLSFTMFLPTDFKNKKIYLKADETKVFAGDVAYMFPGDIEIISDERGFIQTVRRTDHVFDTSDNVILFSDSKLDKESNVLLYAFSSEVIQLNFEDSFITIPNHMQMTNGVNEISFNDNFYRIEIWYETFDSISNTLEKNNLFEVDDLSKFNTYDEVFKIELSDENKIKIITGNGINGKYFAPGKELKYRIYTTKGSQGNTINPELSISLPDDLNEISAYAEFLNNPAGGKDEYTLLELKDAIIKKIQTPDTIITNTDLKNKLSEILSLSSEETFHKLRRNDPIERILDLFIIVKDHSQKDSTFVVPTNTLDIELDSDLSIDNEYNTVKPFFMIESSVIKDLEGKDVRVNRMVPSQKSKNPKNTYYSSYYAIKLQKNPLLCNFFNLNANYSLKYKNVYTNKEVSNEVYINSAIIERDIFSSSNQYFIRLVLDSLNLKFLENNTLIVKARFFNNTSEEDFIIDFVRSTGPDGKLTSNIYEAKITSLDIISNSNKLFIKDVYKLSQKFTDGTEEWAINTQDYSTEIKDNLNCEICIFYNYDTDEVILNKSFQNIRSVRKKLLLSTYQINNIELYQNVDDILYCQTEQDQQNRNIIKIKNMPLYKDEYLKNPLYKNTLNKQMQIEKNIQYKISEKTEFPSRLSLKYFNTYGFSDSYSSLENVSLSLNFEISYRNNKSITNGEIEDIKNNLIKFIDSINKKDITEDKNIYLSDLIQIVKNNQSIVQARLLNFEDNIYFIKSNIESFEYIPASLQLEKENIIFTVKSI